MEWQASNPTKYTGGIDGVRRGRSAAPILDRIPFQGHGPAGPAPGYRTRPVRGVFGWRYWMRWSGILVFTAIFGLLGGVFGYCLQVFGASKAAIPISAGTCAIGGLLFSRTLEPAIAWSAIRSMTLTSIGICVAYWIIDSLVSKWFDFGADPTGLTMVPLLVMVPILGMGNGCLTVVLAKNRKT